MSRKTLGPEGESRERVEAAMHALRRDDRPWYHPRMLVGGSYFGGADVVDVANRAYDAFINYNALYARKAFPSLVEMERDLVDQVLDLARAPEGAHGSITSGGTESLLLAVMTARDRALARRSFAGTPELVVPHAAHPAFDKAAHLMGLRCRRAPTGPGYAVDANAMAALIGPDTFMLAGSAPSYPFGVTDDIEALASLARSEDLWLHVDACHGGFVLPFARKLGREVRPWDLSVEGVTSVSIDVHKLGYANKGVSALLLADAALHEHQRYRFDDWPAGEYATDGITGSRSAGGLASAWAVSRYLGEAGYLAIAGEILASRDRLLAGLRGEDGVTVLGEPDAYLVAFGSDELDAHAIGDGMEARGWTQGRLKQPPAVHLFLDRSHDRSTVDAYLSDLREVVSAVRAGDIEAVARDAIYAT